jgi:putative transposase
MRTAQIKSVRGYKRPRYKVGKPALVAPNQLQRQFQHDEPDHAWVTDITYIRTLEGWLYLTVVLDLHSRAVVGWSMGKSMQTSLVLDALTMAVWRRRPKESVIIHSDQGSQFGSDEFNRWCKDNRLSPSMSRRGNCWDNAVAESFFSNLKSEQIKKRIYQTRAEAKSEIFDYIEGFYNRVDATSISINSAPMSSSGNVKLRYEKCLEVWGNATCVYLDIKTAPCYLGHLAKFWGSVQDLISSDPISPIGSVKLRYEMFSQVLRECHAPS